MSARGRNREQITAVRETAQGFLPFGVVFPRFRQQQFKMLYDLASGFDAIGGSEELAVEYAEVFELLLHRTLEESGLKFAQVTLKSGSKFLVNVEDRFAAQFCVGRLAEAHDLNVFCRLAKPNSLIVDVGANFGLYAIEASRSSAGATSVLAFEPVPHQFKLLEKNITMNGLGPIIQAIPKAVSAKPGTADFFVAKSGSFSGLSDTGRSPLAETIEVPVTTLDQEPALEGNAVNLMKIDVEGFELHVLNGAEGVIERSPDIIIQFEATYKNQSPTDQRQLVEWLAKKLEGGWVLYYGFHSATPGAVVTNANAIGNSMTGNFFLTRKNSQSTQFLCSAIKDELNLIKKETRCRSSKAAIIELMPSLLRKEMLDHKAANERIEELQQRADKLSEEFEAELEKGRAAATTRELKLINDFKKIKTLLDAEVERSSKKGDEYKKQLSQSESAAKEREASLLSDFKAINKQLASLKEIESRLRSENSAYTEKNEALEMELASAKEREASLLSDFKAINMQLTSLKEIESRLRSENSASAEKNEALETELASLRRAKTQITARLASIESSYWWRFWRRVIFPILRPFGRRK